MKIKAKLRKIGNSMGVLLPKEVITGYALRDDIELEVITKGFESVEKVITKEENTLPVITEKKVFNTEPCPKHQGSMKGTCGCK